MTMSTHFQQLIEGAKTALDIEDLKSSKVLDFTPTELKSKLPPLTGTAEASRAKFLEKSRHFAGIFELF